MKGNHLNVASIKQSVVGHKVLCIVMAIMLLTLMIPHGLAFATNQKDEEAQNQFVDYCKEEADSQSYSSSPQDLNENNKISIQALKGEDQQIIAVPIHVEIIGYAENESANISDCWVNHYKFENGKIEITDIPEKYQNVIIIIKALGYATKVTHTETSSKGAGLFMYFYDTDKGLDVPFSTAKGLLSYSLAENSSITIRGQKFDLADLAKKQQSLGLEIGFIALAEGDIIQAVKDNNSSDNLLKVNRHISKETSFELYFKASPLEGYEQTKWMQGDEEFIEKVVESSDIGGVLNIRPEFKEIQKPEINGQVVDEYYQPVEGAHLIFISDKEDYIEAKTDSNGKYSVDVLDGRKWLGAAFYEDLAHDSKIVNNGEVVSSSVTCNFQLIPGVPTAFVDDGNVDKYELGIYIDGEFQFDAEVGELPLLGLEKDTDVYAIGGTTLVFTHTHEGVGEIELHVRPVCNLENPYLPLRWEVNGEELSFIDHYTVTGEESYFYAELSTIGGGYLNALPASEGHETFDIDFNANGYDLYLDKLESATNFKAPEGSELYLDDDEQTLVVGYEYKADYPNLARVVNITVKPVAKAGYKFDHWTLNDEAFDADSYDVMESPDVYNFHAVYVTDDSQGGQGANRSPQTGDFPFAAIAILSLIAAAGAVYFTTRRCYN